MAEEPKADQFFICPCGHDSRDDLCECGHPRFLHWKSPVMSPTCFCAGDETWCRCKAFTPKKKD